MKYLIYDRFHDIKKHKLSKSKNKMFVSKNSFESNDVGAEVTTYYTIHYTFYFAYSRIMVAYSTKLWVILWT
jgi:hypothetical protein